MRTLHYLLVVVIACAGCFSGKKGGGTNINVGTGGPNGEPWERTGGAGSGPAALIEPVR